MDDQWWFSSREETTYDRTKIFEENNDTLLSQMFSNGNDRIDMCSCFLLRVLNDVGNVKVKWFIHMVPWSNNNHRHWFVETSSSLSETRKDNEQINELIDIFSSFGRSFQVFDQLKVLFFVFFFFNIDSLKKISRVCDNNLWSLTAAFVFSDW